MSRTNIILTSTLHDPQGSLYDDLDKACDVVTSNYVGWIVNVTPQTDQRVKDKLRTKKNVYITERQEGQYSQDVVENDHLNALGVALTRAKEENIPIIQYTDGDRVIMAAMHFAEDFERMAEIARGGSEIGKSFYLNLRRSAKDYLSHHPPLVQTELEFNRLYSKVLGIPIDIGSTACVFSTDVVEEIVRRSPTMEAVTFPHPKWLIIAKEMGVSIRSEGTNNVLTFETPEQFRRQVEGEIAKGSFEIVRETDAVEVDENNIAIGHTVERQPLTQEDLERNYYLLQKAYMATLGMKSTLSPAEWSARFTLERQYLTILKNHLESFDLGKDKQDEIEEELKRSLDFAKRQEKVILEALAKTPEEIQSDIRMRAESAANRISSRQDQEKK